MCEYCEKDKTMMSQEIISRSNWGWGADNLIKLTLTEAEEDPVKLAVFIDRGHLRLVDSSDCNCMDAGEKIKIKFCPMCGEKLKEG